MKKNDALSVDLKVKKDGDTLALLVTEVNKHETCTRSMGNDIVALDSSYFLQQFADLSKKTPVATTPAATSKATAPAATVFENVQEENAESITVS